MLSPERMETFARDGYVVLPGLFDAEEMASIARWTDELAALPEIPGRHMVYREANLLHPESRVIQRIENFDPFHGGFRALMDGEKLRGIAAALFGEDAVLFKDKINFKEPGGDGFKPHQDHQAGWNAYAGLFITGLVSIDATTVANGCLEMAPGHHGRGLIGREWEPLNERQMAGMDFVPCPTAPGDAIFFDSYAPHRSAPNLTDRPRRVLYVTYNRASEGDHRARYFADKRRSFPPDCEREPGRSYTFRV